MVEGNAITRTTLAVVGRWSHRQTRRQRAEGPYCVGISVERAALRREFPDVAFHYFESWATTQDWNPDISTTVPGWMSSRFQPVARCRSDLQRATISC